VSGGAGPAVLELRGIAKDYGTVQNPLPVLRGVDLTVQGGEFVAIVGASGSGKSTLLNLLGCLDRPTRGQYLLVGDDVATFDDRRLSQVRKTRIGFVFQSFQLVPHLSVEENVELPLLYARVGRRERRERARALIARVGLGHRGHHLPAQLSGGECQRTALARALVNEPALILADEPTGNLDSRTSAEIIGLLVELHVSGRTIVLITHDAAVAAVAGRRLRLCDGQFVAGDAAAEEVACSAS
jgi:putative ABC transport system ATP-binding protein